MQGNMPFATKSMETETCLKGVHPEYFHAYKDHYKKMPDASPYGHNFGFRETQGNKKNKGRRQRWETERNQ